VATRYVRPAGSRPDFRLVLAFVWGDAADCDTEGNARHPADREWTELYAQNRSRSDEVFNVIEFGKDPLVLTVESPTEWLAAAVANLLAESSGGSVSNDPVGPFTPAKSALAYVGDFDVKGAWSRYQESPFQRSSADNPYPNRNP
jgi:hypothetical protein